MRGRSGDEIIRDLAASQAKYPSLFVSDVRKAGYAGIWVDRIHPESATIESALRRVIAPEPMESRDKRQIFFLLPASPTADEASHR